MNLDELTFGQLKEIGKLACGLNGPVAVGVQHPYLGKFVVVRTWAAGVHTGVLDAKDGNEVILKDARRLWSWNGANTLHEVSQLGVASSSKISQAVPEIWLEAIEIIPCSSKAQEVLSSSKWG